MSDPFEALRLPVTPVEPDSGFAARLRERIERALDLPKGVVVSTMTETETITASAAVPYLAFRDARRAIDWYVDVFGAQVLGEPIVMPDGHIGHAELALAGGRLYLADEAPEIGHVAPGTTGSPVSLVVNVDDADAVRERALAAGATGEREPYDGYGQRNAWIFDPFGHRWLLQSPLASTPAYRNGDTVYVSLWVPDVARATEFFGSVLGWTFAPGHGERERQVEGMTPPHGLWGGEPRSTLFCCYGVDDLDAAVERVRAAGGQAGEPQDTPYGRLADCTDDQGVRFALTELPAAAAGAARAPANGTRPGDIGYVTMEVVDSAKTRAFYGDVLGWRFSKGHIEDGWGVEESVPMTGISGGHEQATIVPLWMVDDIASAVDRVRASGGTSTDPARQPYGWSAECTDGQGTRFYLCEL